MNLEPVTPQDPKFRDWLRRYREEMYGEAAADSHLDAYVQALFADGGRVRHIFWGVEGAKKIGFAVAVINTPVERARLYFRHRPTPVTLLCDPDCHTHRAYGVPHAEFLPDESSKQPEWPYSATMAQFQAARINPTGELPEPLQPMEANTVLNAKDRFALDEADMAIFANHASQLVGHFLVNANGTIAWTQIEALDGPNSLCIFPNAAEIIAAADDL